MNDKKYNNISVPVQYSIQPFEDDRFMKCKILVMHDGLNLNGSVFKMDAIENAKESIKNIPILAYVKGVDGVSEGDFGGHESEVALGSDGTVEYRYLGRPIGVIPADACDYHYEIYDDKTFVAVTGYIYTDYANDALDILMNSSEKGQSMEIRVDDGEYDIYGYYNITSYRYTGLCILGDNVTPAMSGAKLQMFNAKDNFSTNQDYLAIVDELNESLKKYAVMSRESEVKIEMEEKELEVVEEVVEESTEEVVETVEESTEPIVEKQFEEVTEEPTEEVIAKEEVTEEVVTEEVIEEIKEEVAEEMSVEEEEVKEEVEETKVEVDFSVQLKEKDDAIFELNTKLSEIQAKFEALETEVAELREYKRVIEADKSRSEKEAIIEEFSVGLATEEMKSVIDKMDVLSVAEIKAELNEAFTKKNLEKLKQNKFSSNAKSEGIVMDVVKKENSKSKYAV